ncbi:MAG: phosphonate ABC transporter substrate-binding protein [Aestuariivirgaceae bacterium]|nr:phosphonate ABC transporter substrate-binding protein [Aestuariivirgaceae bacterium]
MRNSIKRTVFAAASLLMVGAAQAEEINFGIISTESTQNLKVQWEPYLAEMSKKTGLDIKPFFASDYAGIIEAMKFNKVQVAWYGNKAGMEAVDRAEGEVFAQSVNADGTQGYNALLLTQADSKLNSVEDALKCDKTLTFGNGDPNSTSGFLVPSVFVFGANKVNVKDCYKAVTNANHETNLMAVANGQVDFATNNTENLAIIEAKDPETFKKLKVIWTSPLIPSDPLVWRKDLDQGTKDKLLSFFMGYGRHGSVEEVKAAREVLGVLRWQSFKPSSNSQLFPIRILELNKSINKISSDAAMSQADKDAKIAELKAQQAEIEKMMAELPNT